MDRHRRTGRRPVLQGLALLAGLSLLPLRRAGAAERFTALATTGMVGDIVRALAGDAARVEVLLGSGVDPHTYKLTRADVARLMAADIVFYNGLLLEGKMTDALVRVAGSGRPVLAVTEGLGDDYLLAPDAFAGQYDPHVWMDVGGWLRATGQVQARLAAYRPDLADAVAQRAADYSAGLHTLDAYARTVLGSVPAERRVLVTAHDAFNYFGRAYGFEVQGIQGISTESEAGLRRVQELVDLLVQRRIPAVFVETTVSDRNVRALVEGAAARGHSVRIGTPLFSDAMGAPGSYEGTYVGMIDHNVSAIARALGGQVPAGGMNGRLAAVKE
ncbi:metal ABC transporter solute-binding protein, Zn/Mn family [Oleisolibacter albus]|uniref:metal ABC transporter solute-binding protein, Zn/Mn family n=1 Tax=Oleisolibacter albus TaxID=2171757 RepID=UPI000DF1CC67|nr:zinc ABC transporter substrate-binding protein [Oleisolibacter albus]